MPRARCISAAALCAFACSSGPEFFPAGGGAARESLRVVTFNLFHERVDRAARLQTQLALLKNIDADVVALQEVATGLWLQGDPFELFASALELEGVRFWHQQNLGVFRTGLGLMAKDPIREPHYQEFTDHRFLDPKGFMSASVQTAKGPLLVVNVHMASTDDRAIKESEFHQLERYVGGLAARGPVLVMGDFNTVPEDGTFAQFLAVLGADTVYRHLSRVHPTWNEWDVGDCSKEGGEAIDHILLVPGPGSSLRFRGAAIVVPRSSPPPSDHCPVMAEISLEPAADARHGAER
jgi:endonuclease/exonuclease/phosphatase family metal-dependent hydrolase